jgi:hypothetical protein
MTAKLWEDPMRKVLVVCVAVAAGVALIAQEKALTTAEATSHVGETATVCGKVVGTRYLESGKGQPTFLNFDKPCPNRCAEADMR